ncbi:catecholate siderophore receptor Fiu [Novosphingobium sp. 1949]|uniref:Catecholate siderophore receptor Fiu n=1 Tax=Novosphingobium organovorum TaxID=2930092 RepID=A0ABT0BH77_9SPHN|nr:catecholate siderophore receptor Fiu [Novosphingobium organovorum]MCJ2184420.1 catecholate siderophore receptor Fiu [Novosphingobium organovorum]
MSNSTPRHAGAAIAPACLALSLSLFVPPALAQDATASQTGVPKLGGVTVTDTAIDDSDNGYKAKTSSPKYTAPLADTPQTIQVISRQVIQDQAATTLTEAMRNVAGAGTFNAGEGNGGPLTGDALYMRGFDMSNSIYVDGIRDLSGASRDVFNTEQIEVTKGASGSDYGRSSVGGSINLVSKQPKLDDSIDASAGYGSGDFWRGTLDINKKLSATTAARLNFMGQDAGVAGRDHVKNDRWGMAAAVATGLGTDTRFFAGLEHVEQDNRPDSGLSTVGWSGFSGTAAALSSASKVKSSNYYGASDSHDDSNMTKVTLKAEHDLAANVTVRNTFRWGKITQNYLAITEGVASLDTDDESASTTSRLGAAKDLKNTILTDQLNLTASFDTGGLHHNVSTGVELTREKQTNYGLTKTGTIATLSLYDPEYTASGLTVVRSGLDAYWQTDTVAAYLFDTIDLTDQFQLDLGARYDHYKTTYTSSTADLEAKGDLFTYKIGAVYKLTQQGNVYVNYAVSQQPPGATGSFGAYSLSSSESSASNPSMDPQKARTLEAGSKWNLFGESLLLTGAVFRTWVENEVYAEDDGTYSQIGKKRVTGLELTATGQITPDWNVIGSYTHQKTRITTGESAAQDGSSSLPYAPEDAASLWTTYRTPVGLTVGGGVSYTGTVKRKAKLATTPGEIPSYWLANAMATYRFNAAADVQLNVFNIFNKKYMTSLNYLGYRYQPGLERSARVTLNLHF